MPGGSKKGGGLTTKKSTYGAPYKMKGNPMQRNFPSLKDWWKQSKLKKDIGIARDIIQTDIHKVTGGVAKGFKGTDTEKVVKRVRKTKLAKDISGAVSQVKSDLGKLFKRK